MRVTARTTTDAAAKRGGPSRREKDRIADRLLAAAGLRPRAKGARVSPRKRRPIDGPFAETKELLR